MENFGGMTLSDLKSFEVSLSFTSVLFSMMLASICAEAVGITYRKYARSLGNRVAFSQIFWLLAAVTTIVITIVKFSLALSLGLVGALSIVRFRAAIKEPEELVYLFLVIAIGLSMGAGQLMAGLVLTIFSIVAIIIHSKIQLKKDRGLQLFDVDVLTVVGPPDKSKIFDQYVEGNIPHLEYELSSFNSMDVKFEAVYRIHSNMSRAQRHELMSWMTEGSRGGVEMRLGRSVKIPQ